MPNILSRVNWREIKQKLRLKEGALGPWLVLASILLVLVVFIGQIVDSVRLANHLDIQRRSLQQQEIAVATRSVKIQLESGQQALRRHAFDPQWVNALTSRLGGGTLAEVNRDLDRRRVQEGFTAFYVLDLQGQPWGRSLTAPAISNFDLPAEGGDTPHLLTHGETTYVRWLSPVLQNQQTLGWLVGIRPVQQLLAHLPPQEGWVLLPPTDKNFAKLQESALAYPLHDGLYLARTREPADALMSPLLRQAVSLSVWPWAGLVVACGLLVFLARRESSMLLELAQPRQNRLLMQALLNTSGHAPAVVSDNLGRITHMSRRAENLFGYTQQSQWLGQPARVLFGEEGLPDSEVDTVMCRRCDGQIFTALAETQEVAAGGGFIYWFRDPVETDARVTSAGHETLVQMINQWLSNDSKNQTALCAVMQISGSRPRRGSSLQRLAVRALRQKIGKNELVADLGEHGVGLLLGSLAGKERIRRLITLQGDLRRLLRSVDDAVTVSVGVVTLPRQAADGHEAIERAADAATKAAEAGGSQLLHYDGMVNASHIA